MTASAGLVGKFFHSFKKGTEELHWQGRVLSKQGADIFLVELFNWLTGNGGTEVLATMPQMLEENWIFYSDAEDWKNAGNELTERARNNRLEERELQGSVE